MIIVEFTGSRERTQFDKDDVIVGAGGVTIVYRDDEGNPNSGTFYPFHRIYQMEEDVD